MQNQSKREITFDTQLKTTLSSCNALGDVFKKMTKKILRQAFLLVTGTDSLQKNGTEFSTTDHHGDNPTSNEVSEYGRPAQAWGSNVNFTQKSKRQK